MSSHANENGTLALPTMAHAPISAKEEEKDNPSDPESLKGDESMGHSHERSEHPRQLASAILSHSLSANDPLNPQNWPLHRRILTSFQGWACGFAVAVGLTTFSAATMPFSQDFGLNPMIPEKFIAGFALYLFGIAFAPIWVPHITERVGRSLSYFVYISLNALFLLGAGLSQSVTSVLVCRFFAGFFGGPCLVLLEGTFADIWSAETTNTYYSVQGVASFWGAALGPFFGGYLVAATDGWRWTLWFPVCLDAAVLLLIVTMPETYQREIPRRHNKTLKKSRSEIVAGQSPAESGVTLLQMVRITVLQPFTMLFTQPIVTSCTIIMFITWALTFQWFVSVPAALGPAPPMGPGFSRVRIGKAFLGAIAGSGLGAITVILIEAITNSMLKKRRARNASADFYALEQRLIPAIPGTLFITIALFWVANTVNPNFQPIVPITGTAFFIWGSSMITFSVVPYTFDLFKPAGTLSAITSQAVGRILAAGFLPLVILQDITSPLAPKWGLGLFGFFTLALIPLPIILMLFGAKWRTASEYS